MVMPPSHRCDRPFTLRNGRALAAHHRAGGVGSCAQPIPPLRIRQVAEHDAEDVAGVSGAGGRIRVYDIYALTEAKYAMGVRGRTLAVPGHPCHTTTAYVRNERRVQDPALPGRTVVPTGIAMCRDGPRTPVAAARCGATKARRRSGVVADAPGHRCGMAARGSWPGSLSWATCRSRTSKIVHHRSRTSAATGMGGAQDRRKFDWSNPYTGAILRAGAPVGDTLCAFRPGERR
jgi:hypothetical protein